LTDKFEGEPFDAIMVVSFGGPEGLEDVMPFLRNVVRGKNIPDDRLQAVAHHYDLFGGVSPINEQNRRLIALLKSELDEHQIDLPIYWGNRNWHPMLDETVAKMTSAGVKRALAFVTSAYSSYSGCRQYLEDIERARAAAGVRAPSIEKIKPFYNRSGFIDANVDRLRQAVKKLATTNFDQIHFLFSAHSIPLSMARGCQYVEQLMKVSESVAQSVGIGNWKLVFQSRSGPSTQPWLEPDVCDHLQLLGESGVKEVLVAPIGFVSDHMEVIYDLDTEAAKLCTDLGMKMIRAETVGTHPSFVRMIRELIVERVSDYAIDPGKDCLRPETITDLLGSNQCGTSCCP
jgi:ferrochelatase